MTSLSPTGALVLVAVVAVGAGGPQAWRAALQQAQHVVVVHEARLGPDKFRGEPGELEASPGPATVSETALPMPEERVVLLGGDAFTCQLPVGHAQSRSSRHQELLDARWAPLRHRCHAWRRSAAARKDFRHADVDVGLVAEDPGSWSYRVCFNGEIMMWRLSPGLQRHSIGWHDNTRDEMHTNGSVTLRYMNGTNGRSASVRCDCGRGPPAITSWEVREEGRNHSLALTLASCCNLTHPDGRRWSFHKSFEWLTSPLNSLPCYRRRQGRWVYIFCPANMTLKRVPHMDDGSSVTATSGETGKQTRNAPATLATETQATMLGLGATKPTGLVLARPTAHSVEAGMASSDVEGKGRPASVDGSRVANDLANAIAEAGETPHRAAEAILAPGDVCAEGNHRATVRWICPATWRARAPQREDGHTALIAIERSAQCEWVAWVASLLLCSDWRLLPPSGEARRIQCRRRAAEAALAEPMPQDNDGERQPQRNLAAGPTTATVSTGHPSSVGAVVPTHAPRLDRAGVAFRVGQIVNNVVDGTRGVVVGWDIQWSSRPLVAGPAASETANGDVEPYYVVLADANHLPLHGALKSGTLPYPGRTAYVAQRALSAWHGPRGAASPVRLPKTALGPLFARYDPNSFRFVPSQQLRELYPVDGDGEGDNTPSGTTGMAPPTEGSETTAHIPRDELLEAAANTLEMRVVAASDFASTHLAMESHTLAEATLRRKKKQLEDKLQDFRALSAKLVALKLDTLKANSSDSAVAMSGPDVEQGQLAGSHGALEVHALDGNADAAVSEALVTADLLKALQSVVRNSSLSEGAEGRLQFVIQSALAALHVAGGDSSAKPSDQDERADDWSQEVHEEKRQASVYDDDGDGLLLE